MSATTTADTTPRRLPDEIAQRIVLPEGHVDETKLFEAYRWMRENDPLGYCEVEGYDPLWLVTKYADVREISLQPTIFSNAGGPDAKGAYNPILQNRAGDTFTKALTGGNLRLLESLPFLDPPEHGDVKGMAVEWFKPGPLRQREADMRRIARETIDRHLVAGVNEIDIVQEFATYYPLRVIMALLGVPDEDEPLMWRLTRELFGGDDPEQRGDDAPPPTAESAATQWAATIGEFYAYFDALIADRRRRPTDDLASLIANARGQDGEYFADRYARSWFVAIATAGHETTSSTLAGGLDALAHAPGELAKVQGDPSLVTGLVNEALRFVSPAKHMMRVALEDYEIRGRLIRAGDRVMPLYQSANRDEDVFPDPDVFRVDRRTTFQAAFGFGPHMCIGFNLAKMELRVMFEELLPRIAGLTSGPRDVGPSNHVLNLRRIPVRLELG